MMTNRTNLKQIKTRNFFMALTFLAALFFTSCVKEDETVPKPEINLIELGYENTKTAFRDSDLHIEAEIIAEGRIDRISIEMHHEGEHEKDFAATWEWEVDTLFNEFSGLKNTTFHEHLHVPADADTGHYHFHMTVTDMEGRQSSVEEEVQILPAEKK